MTPLSFLTLLPSASYAAMVGNSLGIFSFLWVSCLTGSQHLFFCSQWRQQRTIQALLEKLVSFEKLNYSSSHFYYKGNEVKLCNSDMVQMADRKPIRCETDSACDSFILQKGTIFGNAPRLVIRVRKWWENWTHSRDYIKLTQWI